MNQSRFAVHVLTICIRTDTLLVLHVHNLRLVLCAIHDLIARLSTHINRELGAVLDHPGMYRIKRPLMPVWLCSRKTGYQLIIPTVCPFIPIESAQIAHLQVVVDGGNISETHPETSKVPIILQGITL